MLPAIFYFTLDIDDACSHESMNVCQGDNGRHICVSLRQSGKAYNVDEDCRAECIGVRPDGAVFFNDCRIENGQIFCTLTGSNTAFCGTVVAEIRIYGTDDTIIASPAFTINVRKSTAENGPVAGDEETISLLNLISQARAAIKAAESSRIQLAQVNMENGEGAAAADVELIPGETGQTLRLNFTNLKGEMGPAGPQGPEGAAGPQGPQGDPGPRGEAGKGFKVMDFFDTPELLREKVTDADAGDAYGVGSEEPYDIYIYSASGLWVNTGTIQGPQGERGEKGDTGAQGPQGEPGEKGDTGAQGPQGERGEKGDTGAQGPQGERGEKGDTGAQGPAGPAYTLTDEDKSGIVTAVMEALPAWTGGSY